jgi:hypothetical protein
MQKALLFFLAVVIIGLIVFMKPVEGFSTLMGVSWTDMNEGTPASLYSKLPINQPKVVDVAEAGIGNVQPSPPSAGTLPSAPAPQRSKETPNPYRDPTLEPAKYIRLLGVKEDLQAFFGFQAFMLEDRGDPSIQIPLTRARADMAELINVQSVMERNPGLPSRINNKQLDDIRSNLEYLRDILHELEASGAIQPQALEGFTDTPQADISPVHIYQEDTSYEYKTKEEIDKYMADMLAKSVSTQPDTIEKRATLKELQDFQIKVVVEITRLEAPGTSDPVIVGRLNTLNRIKNDVDQVIQQIQDGVLTPETVPIYSSDIEKALPLLGNPSDPLPNLLEKTGLPPAIQNLFPGGMSPKDTEQAAQINNIMTGYMENLFEGASWGVGVNLNFQYDNPKIAQLKADAAKGAAASSTGLPGVQTAPLPVPQGADPQMALTAAAKPDFNERTTTTFDAGLPGLSITRTLPEPTSGRLDWKQRSQQIREQIRRRGLNPADFGALPEDAQVGSDFSWRGYTQMMCMRLNTTPDPGLAQSVGCPPTNWQGWRD